MCDQGHQYSCAITGSGKREVNSMAMPTGPKLEHEWLGKPKPMQKKDVSLWSLRNGFSPPEGSFQAYIPMLCVCSVPNNSLRSKLVGCSIAEKKEIFGGCSVLQAEGLDHMLLLQNSALSLLTLLSSASQEKSFLRVTEYRWGLTWSEVSHFRHHISRKTWTNKKRSGREQQH